MGHIGVLAACLIALFYTNSLATLTHKTSSALADTSQSQRSQTKQHPIQLSTTQPENHLSNQYRHKQRPLATIRADNMPLPQPRDDRRDDDRSRDRRPRRSPEEYTSSFYQSDGQTVRSQSTQQPRGYSPSQQPYTNGQPPQQALVNGQANQQAPVYGQAGPSNDQRNDQFVNYGLLDRLEDPRRQIVNRPSDNQGVAVPARRTNGLTNGHRTPPAQDSRMTEAEWQALWPRRPSPDVDERTYIARVSYTPTRRPTDVVSRF